MNSSLLQREVNAVAINYRFEEGFIFYIFFKKQKPIAASVFLVLIVFQKSNPKPLKASDC